MKKTEYKTPEELKTLTGKTRVETNAFEVLAETLIKYP
jgi:hypothetical protein